MQTIKRYGLIGLLGLLGTSLVLGCSNDGNIVNKPSASIQPVLPPLAEENTTSEDKNMRRVCTMDVRQCPDGSYISRDAGAGCVFRACPGNDK